MEIWEHILSQIEALQYPACPHLVLGQWCHLKARRKWFLLWPNQGGHRALPPESHGTQRVEPWSRTPWGLSEGARGSSDAQARVWRRARACDLWRRSWAASHSCQTEAPFAWGATLSYQGKGYKGKNHTPPPSTQYTRTAGTKPINLIDPPAPLRVEEEQEEEEETPSAN